MVHLISVDTERLMALVRNINTLWLAPLQIGLATYFLYYYLG